MNVLINYTLILGRYFSRLKSVSEELVTVCWPQIKSAWRS